MNRTQAERFLREQAREIDFLENTVRTLSWDMRVNLPRSSGEYRGNTIGFLSAEIFRRKTAPALEEALCILEEETGTEDGNRGGKTAAVESETDAEILRAMVRKFRREYRYLREVPPSLNSEYAAHNLKCELVWQEARARNDYAMLKPWLEKEFGYLRQIAAAHGYGDDPLTGLMSAGEPGLTREKVDRLFEELRSFELPFLEKLKDAPHQPEPLQLTGAFPEDRQRALCMEVLSTVGFDFDRGRLDVSAHPYTTANDPNDIRFTTRYTKDSFVPALMSCMHEGGHGMHAQNAMPALRYTTLENAPFDAICESQSRYTENIIGYSLPFWEYFLPLAEKYFPQLERISPQRFYESLNRLNFSPSRMKADELTYNLHIMIRYELEKLLFDREIGFDELPEMWSRKYREYLGVVPQSDAEGVLQDMHWSSGYIGYFQSYVMGNFYDGHWYAAMRRDVPDFYSQVREGNFSGVTGWLREHIQQYGGMYTPSELLKRVDGEELSAGHYIGYIREKYAAIYRL